MCAAAISVASEGDRAESGAVRLIRDHPGLLWLAGAGLYLALCAYLPSSSFLLERTDRVVSFAVFGLVSLLLILPAVFADDGPGLPRRFLANRVVQWLGLVSYGIFLWHIAVLAQLHDRIDGACPATYW